MFGAALWFSAQAAGNGNGSPDRPEVQAFIAAMAERHGFDPDVLGQTLASARFQPAIVRAISAPSTARPWSEFRPIFINAQRIGGGIGFWDENEATLERAEMQYGVPAEVVVAVIWIIDPLDGTTNYLHGYPQFSVSIGLYHQNKPFQAVVFDPLKNELYTASRGAGAQLNDRRMRVSGVAHLQSALFATGFPYKSMDNLEV